jgi:hypothetical protein
MNWCFKMFSWTLFLFRWKMSQRHPDTATTGPLCPSVTADSCVHHGSQLVISRMRRIGAPIIFGPSLSALERESMLRTYLVCRENQEGKRERETSERHEGEAHSVLTTAILLPQRLSCYWGKIVSLRILTNLTLSDLRLTTAQLRSTGQNLPSDL